MARYSSMNFRQSVGRYDPNSLAARPVRVPGQSAPLMMGRPAAAPVPVARPQAAPAPMARPAAPMAARPKEMSIPTSSPTSSTPSRTFGFTPLGQLMTPEGGTESRLGRPLGPMDARQRPGEIPIGPLNDGMPSWLGSAMNTPLPFGGAYARGGIAPAGAVSMVGEQGPELIVPSGPTQVIPLSERGTRPIGRSANDPERIAEQMRRAGNPEALLRLAMLDRRFGNDGRAAPRMPAAAPMPILPPQPKGRWVAGRSAGSQVWQEDAPAAPMPMMAAAAPAPMPMPPALPAPAPEAPMNPFELDPLGNYVNPQAAMVPNGFGAMNERLASNPAGFPGLPMPPPGLYGPEAAPRFVEYQAGNMNLIVDSTTGKQVQSYKRPQPLGYEPVPGINLLLPKGDGADRLPVLQQQGMMEAPRPEAAFMGPMPGKPKLAPYTPPTQPTDTPKIPEGIVWEKDISTNKITGAVYPTYNEQGKLVYRRIDADGDGVVSPAEQAAAQSAAATQGKSARGATWSLAMP